MPVHGFDPVRPLARPVRSSGAQIAEVWGAQQLRGLVERGQRGAPLAIPAGVGLAAEALLDPANAGASAAPGWASLLEQLRANGTTTLRVDFDSLGGPADSRALRLTGLVKQLHGHGFVVHGRFTLGQDHDDVGSFERLVAWVEAVGLGHVELRLWTPDPGSVEVRELARVDRVRHQHLDRWDGAHVVIAPKQMSAETLYRGWAWARRRLSSLPSIWARRPRDWAALLPFLRALVGGPDRLRSARLRARVGLVASYRG